MNKQFEMIREVGDKDYKFEWFFKWFLGQENPFVSFRYFTPNYGDEIEVLHFSEDGLPVILKIKYEGIKPGSSVHYFWRPLENPFKNYYKDLGEHLSQKINEYALKKLDK